MAIIFLLEKKRDWKNKSEKIIKKENMQDKNGKKKKIIKSKRKMHKKY